MGSVADRILDRYGKKTASLGYRTDISVSDMRTHSSVAAALLMTYNPAVGDVSGEQLGEWFHQTYQNKVVPCLATARKHAEGVLSVVAEVVTTKRPFEDSKKMMAIGSASFIDTTLNETYDVKATASGQRYLARVSQDDIAAIIQERNKRMAVTASRQVSWDEVDGGVAILDRGDKVKLFYNDTIVHGEITSVAGDKVVVKSATGETITTGRSAVLEVIQKSREAVEKSKSSELAYYTQMYGSEQFARQLLGLEPSGM